MITHHTVDYIGSVIKCHRPSIKINPDGVSTHDILLGGVRNPDLVDSEWG
ncbi:hypothetical protein [Rahnella variigena]|nr:hypothetical protein [Rahnella variigena]